MRNFRPSEFKCCEECGKCFYNVSGDLIEMLDKARDIAGISFKLTSTIRCINHNREVGGSDNSAHLGGYAADIECLYSMNRWKIVNALIDVGFTRIGIGKTFIHCDISPIKPDFVMWVYD